MKVPMARLQIVGLKREMSAVLTTVQRLGCLQIEDASQQPDLSVRPLQPDREIVQQGPQLNHLVSRIEGLLATFAGLAPAGAPLPADPTADYLTEATAGVEALASDVGALLDRRDSLRAEQLDLPRYQDTLSKLLPIVPASARAADNVFAGVLVGRQHQWVLDALTDELLRITGGQGETASKPIDGDFLAMILVFPRALAGEVEALLGQKDLTRLRLPDNIERDRPDDALLAIQRRLAAIPDALNAVEAELRLLAQRWQPRLQLWHGILRGRLAERQVLNRLGETDQTFVLVGWAPEADVPRLTAALAEAGTNAVVSRLPQSPALMADAPVLLQNPAPARPFESLTKLLNLPRYDGLDPTILMALFLPLFFGMILGDAGYGLVLLLLCVWGLRRFKAPGTTRNMIIVLAIGSGWSIVFGLLYGELFGTLGEHLGLHALWLERGSAEQVQALLLFAIAVGVVHVVLGLLLGLYAAVRARSRGHTLERGGILVGLIGLFLIVAVLVELLPPGLMSPAYVLLLLGIVMLGASQGWLGILLGPIEFLGVIGNILSYLRIAAIGLASVYVARLANDLAGGLGSIIVGVIVAVLIHALNIVLGAFSPTIHSMRLHYVEFFKLFFEGGGRPFTPFTLAVEPDQGAAARQ
ncbi:MAG: hypothetical protein H6651_06605 [Ardenticatenales bacterium]|nr:hypothetical protein [Ardenticatenales bacterium]